MGAELYIIIAFIAAILIAGSVMSGSVRKKAKEKNSIISWYNHLIDQFVSIFDNVAENYNEKMKLAERYCDEDAMKRLHKLYNDTNRTAENIEQKLNFLKENIADKNLRDLSLNQVFEELKIVESYIAELSNIALLIRGIHPVNRSSNTYDFEDFFNQSFETAAQMPWKSSMFFSSCENKDDLTKKYRELAKIYHPDNSVTGNAESFRQLKSEYDEYLKLA